jgi:NAD(P)-dependent dehydrogenase (short-subunit alcohol dehydrogenase family)
MAWERHLLRSPSNVPPRGNVGLCAGQGTFPESCGHHLAKAPFGGLSGGLCPGAPTTGRLTQPGEVADLILFLASDGAANITGLISTL